MTDFYDKLEVREPAERERDLLAALPRQIAHAQSAAPAFTKILDGVKPEDVVSREALARLPVTRKTDLLALQKERRASDPFGGFAAIVRGPRMPRVFASPGTIYEPEGEGRDYWRTARALFAAGFRGGELIHNSFSYHMTPAGSIMESGAHALGCSVFAGGTGQTEQQLEAIAELRPEGYAGTPSFLKILLEKAAEKSIELPSLTKALVSGEAFPPSLRDWIDAHGVRGTQCYATADLGLIA
ncbi:MAG: phenylacetate--CoA ligase family protein, partial [Variovorax sp.]